MKGKKNAGKDAEVVVANVAKLAYVMHARDTPPREGSGLPYVTHPARVVDLLKQWGFSESDDPLVIALGWAHDLKEDTGVTDGQIVEAGGAFGERLLSGVNALTFTTHAENPAWSPEEHDRRKADYLKKVAGGDSDFLVVKIADRLCNALERAETDPVRALGYLRKGEPLFARIGELARGDLIRSTLDSVRRRLSNVEK